MPPPSSSLKPPVGKGANGTAVAPPKKTAPVPAVASTNGTTDDGEKKAFGKPDPTKYNAEQEEHNKEIAGVKAKLDAIRSRISLTQAPTSNDRRSQLKAEMDDLRGEQGKFKADRGRTLDEMKRLQEGVGRKIKDVQAQKGKMSFRNVVEIDDRIASLDKQIESGSMKLVDEKKALQEISTLRRSRKTMELSGSADDAIAADRARIDELRKQLDDPESRKVSDRFDELKKEMDGLREEGNKAYEERGKLFDERNAFSAQMVSGHREGVGLIRQDELYGKKRESAQKFREDNDKYYAKVHADRQARNGRFKAEKAKEDAVRRDEEITRLREEAKMPAFGGEIEDCNVLIGWFKGKYGGGAVPATHAGDKMATAQLQGVKELETRKVEGDFAGMTLKKKDEDEELGGFFGGQGKGKKKGKKGEALVAAEGSGKDAAVNLPMSLLSALLVLGISPPTGKEDISRTLDDLDTKKAWFEANSATKTKAEIERVEKLIAKMQKKIAAALGDVDGGDEAIDGESTMPETGGAKEPTHTVAISGAADGKDIVDDDGLQLPTDASPGAEVKQVDSALQEVKDGEE